MPIASTEDNHEVPRVESTRISVIDIYTSYARRGQEPAEVTAGYDIPLADVHEALAYYYRHPEEMRDEEAAEDRSARYPMLTSVDFWS